MDIINYSIMADAPPYIIIVICLSLILVLIALLDQYKTHNVNIYEVPFGGIKLHRWIKICVFFISVLLFLSLLNIIVSFGATGKNTLHFLIKIFLSFSVYSVYFALFFQYYKKYKEELQIQS